MMKRVRVSKDRQVGSDFTQKQEELTEQARLEYKKQEAEKETHRAKLIEQERLERSRQEAAAKARLEFAQDVAAAEEREKRALAHRDEQVEREYQRLVRERNRQEVARLAQERFEREEQERRAVERLAQERLEQEKQERVDREYARLKRERTERERLKREQQEQRAAEHEAKMARGILTLIVGLIVVLISVGGCRAILFNQPPAPLGHPTITNVSDTTMRVHWRAPDANGDAITRFSLL